MLTDEQLCELGLTIRAKLREHIVKQDLSVLWSIDTGSMAGACAIASFILARVLQARGIQAHFTLGHFIEGEPDYGDTHLASSHCWVELAPDGKRVDITATQFGEEYPEVYIDDGADRHFEAECWAEVAEEMVQDWCEQSPFAKIHWPEVQRIIGELSPARTAEEALAG